LLPLKLSASCLPSPNSSHKHHLLTSIWSNDLLYM
jgi:hypothetical protein